jgi:hypothetical protein
MVTSLRSWIVMVVAATCLTPPAVNARHKPADRRVVVVDVREHDGYRPVERAKVFILGADGRELAVGLTDASGRARLTYVPASEHPRDVLVDADAYFVAGNRWGSGQLEYWVDLVRLYTK